MFVAVLPVAALPNMLPVLVVFELKGELLLLLAAPNDEPFDAPKPPKPDVPAEGLPNMLSIVAM